MDTTTEPFDIPILFIVFNRLEPAKKVFQKIREARPSHLYISSDGPRSGRAGESALIRSVRDYLLQAVDWPCRVQTRFQEANLGCAQNVSSSLDWFFSQVEMGIILEDDCLPSASFFDFCREALLRYRDDDKVMHVGGTNLLPGWGQNRNRARFSRLVPIWGWATWSRAWNLRNPSSLEMAQFLSGQGLDVWGHLAKTWRGWFLDLAVVRNWKWGPRWILKNLTNRSSSVLPPANLIVNIGFGGDSTHTKGSPDYIRSMRNMEVEAPYGLDQILPIDEVFDRAYLEKMGWGKPGPREVVSRLALWFPFLSRWWSALRLLALPKKVGKGTFLHRTVSVLGWTNVTIGANSVLSERTWINVNSRQAATTRFSLGDNSYVGKDNFFTVGQEIAIGAYFMSGVGCRFLGSDHGVSNPLVPYVSAGASDTKSIVIGSNVWLGADVTIAGNVVVGSGSVIGAGSLVLKDIPRFAIAVGNPAKVIKRFSFRSQEWVPADLYTPEDEATCPTEEEYLRLLALHREPLGKLRYAASKDWGDLP